MQVLISAEGKHLDSAGRPIPHAMVVNNHLVLLDLTSIGAPLVDPTILRATWGMQVDGVEVREGGCIVRQDGHRQLFWDKALLAPYLEAYAVRRAELEPKGVETT